MNKQKRTIIYPPIYSGLIQINLPHSFVFISCSSDLFIDRLFLLRNVKYRRSDAKVLPLLHSCIIFTYIIFEKIKIKLLSI